MQTPAYNTWCGLAFERVCLLHTRQIKMALGITGILANLFSWHIHKTDDHPGVQIDLLIDRADNILNVCEIKYAANGFALTSAGLANLKTKMSVLQQYVPAKKFISPVLITSNGAKHNKYSAEIPAQVTAAQLFEP